jgi:hypothetical protein
MAFTFFINLMHKRFKHLSSCYTKGYLDSFVLHIRLGNYCSPYHERLNRTKTRLNKQPDLIKELVVVCELFCDLYLLKSKLFFPKVINNILYTIV